MLLFKIFRKATLQNFEKIFSLLIVKFSCRQCMYVKILMKPNVEMTLFRSKNVFYCPYPFFLLKKTSNFNDIDYYFRI